MLASKEITLDPLLRRRRSADYTCVDLAIEAWAMITGRDLSAMVVREERESLLRNLRPLARRADPCVVLMRGGWEDAHIGIFYRGRIMHLTHDVPQFATPAVATAGFRQVSYYA